MEQDEKEMTDFLLDMMNEGIVEGSEEGFKVSSDVEVIVT